MLPDDSTTMAGAALIGFAIWELHKAYTSQCPDLRTLRWNDDPRTLQELVDADISVGIIAVIAGVGGSLVMRSWAPAVIVSLTYVGMVVYRHSILSDPA